MPEFRYFLYDVITGNVTAELPFSDTSYSETINASGTFSGVLPLKGLDALSTDTLEVASTGIAVDLDGQIVWHGIVWALNADATSNRLRVSAEGTFSWLNRRVAHSTDSLDSDLYSDFKRIGLTGPEWVGGYSGTGGDDPLVIAQELVTYAQSRVLFGDSADLGITTGGERSGPYRTLKEDYTLSGESFPSIGGEMSSLASLWDSGFDFRFTASWGTGGHINRRFECANPHLGNVTDVSFDYGRNIVTLSYQRDATSLAGFIAGTGDSYTDPQYVYADGSYDYPLLDAVYSWPRVEYEVQIYWLATARLKRFQSPHSVPRILTSYDLAPEALSLIPGDEVTVRAEHGYLHLDGKYRVATRTVSPGNEGQIGISLDLIPTEVFD